MTVTSPAPPLTATAGTALGTHIGRLAAAAPDRPAITCGPDSITRAELESRSNRLARAYRQFGVEQDSLVTIALPNGVEFLVAALAVWKCGATPQPISARLPDVERNAIIELAQPRLIIGITPDSASGTAAVPAGYSPDPGLDDTPLDLPPAASLKAPTSGGSTGRPKLIVSTQPASLEAVEPFARLLGMQDEDTALIPGPLYHNAPFLLSACALALGGHVVLMPRFEAGECVRLAELHGATWMYLVPTMMGRISRLPDESRRSFPPASLRAMMHMAAPCPSWLKQDWIDWLGPDRVLELYGATEVQSVTIATGREWLERPGTVGKPVIGEMRILDDDGVPVPPGAVGELWMRRGEGFENPYRYIGAEARVREGGWESVGDMAAIDSDGYVFLADRKSDMILVGGSNVYPAEIEAALTEHPSIRSAVVIGMPDDDLGQVPHALLEMDGAADDEELRTWLSDRLASYKLPRSYERVDIQLRDDAGKVRRAQLAAARGGRR